MLFKMFRTPYLDADDGANLGGGAIPPEPTPTEPEPSPEPQGGNEPAPEPTPEPQKIKVKYNHQELELPYDEAVTHIQKGMNYDKAIERARQEAAQEAAQQARDEWIASQGYEWKGKHIATEAEYNEALKEHQMEQEILQKYAHLPEDVQSELLENRKFREQYQSQQKIIEEQQRRAQQERDFITRRDAMYAEFLEEFPDQNTEEAWAKIPAEVWAEADRWLKTGGREGRRLADALTRHNWKQSMAQNQANQANQANANSSMGSVKGQGKNGTFFTREQVANMSREEIKSNYNSIKESEKHWK